jgi:hypothetical protein
MTMKNPLTVQHRIEREGQHPQPGDVLKGVDGWKGVIHLRERGYYMESRSTILGLGDMTKPSGYLLSCEYLKRADGKLTVQGEE